jgi:hypothetical protein
VHIRRLSEKLEKESGGAGVHSDQVGSWLLFQVLRSGCAQLPSSSQLKNALAYVLITSLVLIFLNIYSATTTRKLMFQAKYASAQDKIQLVVSSFSGVDTLTK